MQKETNSYLNVICNKQTIYKFLLKILKKWQKIFLTVAAFSGDKESNIFAEFSFRFNFAFSLLLTLPNFHLIMLKHISTSAKFGL